MRATILVGLLAAACAPAGAAELPEVIGPANAGKVQCYFPDQVRKTCRVIAAYEAGPDGEIMSWSETLVPLATPMAIKVSSPVYLRDGRLCGVMRQEHVQAASIRTLSGKPAPAAVAKFRAQFAEGAKAFIGRDACTAFASGGGDYQIGEAYLDGRRFPEGDQPFIWVSPAEGYRVAL